MESLEPGTKKDIAKIKDKVFGPMVFWVTDTRPDIGRAPGSYLVRLLAFLFLCEQMRSPWSQALRRTSPR